MVAASEADYLGLIPALPLAAAVVHVFFGARLGRGKVGRIACLAVAGSFVLSLVGFLRLQAAAPPLALVDNIFTWIESGSFRVDLALTLDPLSAVMCLVVTGVGLLIHVYSTGYMAHDPDYARYFAYLNLFMAAMLLLVLADDLVVMFIGWEGVGLASYLLIGFWYSEGDKALAGRKAFVFNRIGDAAFLVGAFLLYWTLSDLGAGSLRFAVINQHAPMMGAAAATAAALLLFAGATGKSAQIPLFVWLPDAMAGPTPVSALIHAATMVTAGIYMVARLSGLYMAAPDAMAVMAVVGAATALGAAGVAVTQNDIKKVLAYSTVSQLGYMFLALGVGAFGAAVFHVVTHAFFKGLLFLGAGSVIHALGEEQDIRRMGGLARAMPVTSITFVVATAAIAGVPGLSGFFSKDEILASVFAHGNWGLWVVAVAGAALTAFYMTRLTVLVFAGSGRSGSGEGKRIHESPPSMTVPLALLAAGAAAAGLMGVPEVLGGHNRFAHFLAPVVGHHSLGLGHGLELSLMAVSVAAASAGILAAWLLYRRGPEADRVLSARAPRAYRSAASAYYVDRAYERGVALPALGLGERLWKGIDGGVIDTLVDATAALAAELSEMWRRMTTGNFQHYALILFVAAAAMALALVSGVGN